MCEVHFTSVCLLITLGAQSHYTLYVAVNVMCVSAFVFPHRLSDCFLPAGDLREAEGAAGSRAEQRMDSST